VRYITSLPKDSVSIKSVFLSTVYSTMKHRCPSFNETDMFPRNIYDTNQMQKNTLIMEIILIHS